MFTMMQIGSALTGKGERTMPDREKIIKGWETVLSRDPLDAPWDLIDETLALLKEQEAVEPKTVNNGEPEPETTWWYICGNCGLEIEYDDHFCRWCGRAVKWE